MPTNFQTFYELSPCEPTKWTQPIYFQRPQIVDIMEFDEGQLRKPTNLRYFKNPPRPSYPLDLNDGFEDYVFRNDTYFCRNLAKIEKHLMENKSSICEDCSAEEKCKIYTSRSVLLKTMLTPYRLDPDSCSNYYFCASKFNDAIWISHSSKASTKPDRNSKNDSYHFKFEQYCFSDSPATAPKTDIPIDENKQTYCIFRSQLKDFDITYSAEINGVDSEREIKDLTNPDELNKCRFVLTKLLPDYQRKWRSNKKVLNWFIQAYLSKTDDIYFGFKDKYGKVYAPVEKFTVKDIPKDQNWKPSVCNAFLHNFLNLIKVKMAGVDCPYTVYEFKYDTAQKSIDYRIHEGRTEYSFLTDRLIDHMQKQRV